MLTDVFLFFAGITVGAMNAIAGGGLLVGFPALLASGHAALMANATGYLMVLPGQLSSAVGYRDYLRKVPKKYAWLLVPCMGGAFVGTTMLRHTPSSKFESLVPVLILLAVALFVFQPFIRHHLNKHIRTGSNKVRPLVFIGIGLLPVAIYGGYFGAGFGLIMLAFLSFTNLHDTHRMNAMKNVGATSMCLVSIAVLAQGGFIDWHAGFVMSAGTVIGGYAGARYAQRVSGHAIRLIILAIGITTATYIALRTY